MRCLVTGASGFIGTQFFGRIPEHDAGHYVPMVRSPEAASALRAQGFRPVMGDLLDAPSVRSALAGCDAVVHLAQGGRGPVATRHLVECAASSRVQRFVHISSMSVHGPTPGPEAAREETARIGRYDHDYSDSKAEQEEIVQAAFQKGALQTVLLRPTVVYGPGSHFVLQIIEEARRGVVTVFDEGGDVCNAVFVDDVCDAIDAALTRSEAVGQAMFINANHAITWGEFIRAFAESFEPRPRFESLSSAEALAYWSEHPTPSHRGLAARIAMKIKRLAGWQPPVHPWPPLGRVQRETLKVFFANDRAKRLLNWTPKVDFPAGAELTRRWLKAAGSLP